MLHRQSDNRKKQTKNVPGCGGNCSGIKVLLQQIYEMDLVSADGIELSVAI